MKEKVVRMQYDESMSGKLNICINIFSSESNKNFVKLIVMCDFLTDMLVMPP